MVDKADREQMAKFYEERRGDVAGWKPTGQRLRSRGDVTSVFSVRFTHEELEVIESAAEHDRKPISAFVRDAALAAALGRPRIEPALFGAVYVENIDIRSALYATPLVGVA